VLIDALAMLAFLLAVYGYAYRAWRRGEIGKRRGRVGGVYRGREANWR
jgi:hypothetical protein